MRNEKFEERNNFMNQEKRQSFLEMLSRVVILMVGLCIAHLGVTLFLLIVDRAYIKIGTILCMLCGGPIIDLFSIILKPLFVRFDNFPFKLVSLALGCVILAYGMTIVIKSDAGTGPNDLVAVVISDKSKKKFSVIRMIVDFTFVLIGFLLGGSFGVGTIICAFLVGPVAGIFLPVNEKIINRIVVKKEKPCQENSSEIH